MKIPPEGLKINVGAGGRRYPGWIGVDLVADRKGTDVVADATSIPLPDACANELMAIHLVEHCYEWDVPVALAEWFRLLRPGGKLVLEMPDVIKACKNIAEDFKGDKHVDQQGLWAILGDPRAKDPMMIHKSLWWFERLKPVVEAVGFHRVTEHRTMYHPVGRDRRDFRLEAYKPERA